MGIIIYMALLRCELLLWAWKAFLDFKAFLQWGNPSMMVPVLVWLPEAGGVGETTGDIFTQGQVPCHFSGRRP